MCGRGGKGKAFYLKQRVPNTVRTVVTDIIQLLGEREYDGFCFM